jgi:hypothetical protein
LTLKPFSLISGEKVVNQILGLENYLAKTTFSYFFPTSALLGVPHVGDH